MIAISKVLVLLSLVVLLATLVAAADYSPRNIHIALQGESSAGLSVQWTTTSYNEVEYSPTIYYGYLQDTLPIKITGTSCRTTTYTNEEYHHTCFIPTLSSGMRYFYRIGKSSDGDAASPVYKFFTPPGTFGQHKSILLGDLGVENGQNTVDSLQQWLTNPTTGFPYVTHINHCGDISYADDGPYQGKLNPDFEPMNNKFAEMIQPLATKVAYMVAPGNHDVNQSIRAADSVLPDWGRNFTHYRQRWAMPLAHSGSSQNMWYTYNIGVVQYIVINTETDYPDAPFSDKGDVKAGPFGDQVAWLERELIRADNSRVFTPWVVVIGHRPVYSSLKADFPSDQQEKLRAWLEPLFQKYRVDLYVSGHSHLYERTYPMADGKSTQQDYNQPSNTVYVVNGQAGNLEGHPVPGEDVLKDLPEFIPFRESLTFGYGLLETFPGLPPETPHSKTRDNKRGDFLSSDRLWNTTPQGEAFDQFFENYEAMVAKANDKLTSPPRSTRLNKCPGSAMSMCYSSYPSFNNPRLVAEQQYLDRFCIIKCR